MNHTEFKEKFAVDETSGAYVFKADACMNRWNADRDDELVSHREEIFNGGVEWRKEQRLWAFAYDIAHRLGIRPKAEDLEEFVKSHLELEVV